MHRNRIFCDGDGGPLFREVRYAASSLSNLAIGDDDLGANTSSSLVGTPNAIIRVEASLREVRIERCTDRPRRFQPLCRCTVGGVRRLHGDAPRAFNRVGHQWRIFRITTRKSLAILVCGLLQPQKIDDSGSSRTL